MRQIREVKGIRVEYEEHGATGFYEQFGEDYRNPHEPIICEILHRAASQWNFDLPHWRVLDLACGSGEATLALCELGAKSIDGFDPYTSAAYFKRTQQHAEAVSFADIASGVLQARRYDLCVCSFALHLSPPSLLPLLCWQLATSCARLLVLTPHKRPHISSNWGWNLKGEMIEQRVRAQFYESAIIRSG